MNALISVFKRTEQGILVVALALATILPLIDMVGRPLGGFHLVATAEYVQQLTLWLAFVGGMAATSQAKHLTLSTSEFFGEGLWRDLSRLLSYAVAAAVVAVLAYASWQVVAANKLEPKMLPIGIPEWVSEIIMPVAMGVMALQFVWNSSNKWWGRLVALAAVGGAFAIGLVPPDIAYHLRWLALLVLAAALLGAPVFVAMGGVALVLFFSEATPVAAVTAEVYRLIDSPTLPAIPLLTAAGYVLAESAAAERLVRFFRAVFG
ncbi:MAG: TRAP transporter small permease subunit, partial [Gemmatimonadaceae bacterium]|nr:TRAP transporter small permease subunit [Gemmatimonadaceae bacterium]